MFRKCSYCGHLWKTRNEFLTDPSVALIGYQANFEALTTGLLFFNHRCGTTIAMHADVFADLHDGPIFTERQTESDSCPGYCLNQEDLNPCPAVCECASVRKIIQRINHMEKSADGDRAPGNTSKRPAGHRRPFNPPPLMPDH